MLLVFFLCLVEVEAGFIFFFQKAELACKYIYMWSERINMKLQKVQLMSKQDKMQLMDAYRGSLVQCEEGVKPHFAASLLGLP